MSSIRSASLDGVLYIHCQILGSSPACCHITVYFVQLSREGELCIDGGFRCVWCYDVDPHFNGNGGWQDCLFSKCTVLAVPSFRDRIPVIVDRVTTLCGPGELVDVVVTERGIAINPLRKDLLQSVRNSGLPVRDLIDIQQEVFAICGGRPAAPSYDMRQPIAVVRWVDGTLLDSVFQVEQNHTS